MTEDAARERWEAHEADWIAEHKRRQGDYLAAKHRRAVTTAAKVRIKTYQWAETMVEPLRLAREALRPEGKADSNRAVAKWLTDEGYRSPENRGLTHKTVQQLLYDIATENYAYQAVLECRTRMTAIALSADFESADRSVEGLETEYVDIIADAVALGRRLKGARPLTREQEVAEAWRIAKGLAERQRREKGVTMEARDALWRDDYPRPVRLVLSDRKDGAMSAR